MAKSESEEDGVSGEEAKNFLQALVVDLRAEAGRSFDYDNELIQLSYLLHPFFRGNPVVLVNSK